VRVYIDGTLVYTQTAKHPSGLWKLTTYPHKYADRTAGEEVCVTLTYATDELESCHSEPVCYPWPDYVILP
jgi:hypothetical protein